MAAGASLPEPIIKGLNEIAVLPTAAFDNFLAALRALPVDIRQHRVFPDFQVAGLRDDGEAIKGTAFALVLSRAQRRVSVAELADGVMDAVSPGMDPKQAEITKDRIVAILNIESLDLIARAHSVLLEHACTHSSARVVSDIRAVFGDDVNAQPEAAVIVHMLNLVYYRAGSRENFVVALDEKDIEQLIGVLERARTKSKTLRQTVEKSGIRYIGVA